MEMEAIAPASDAVTAKPEFGCKCYHRRCKIRAPCCDEIRMRLQISMEKQKDRHELPRREFARVAQVCMNCGVTMGRTQGNRREKRKVRSRIAIIVSSELGSVVDVSLSEEVGVFGFDGMQSLKEEDKEHTLLKHKFYLSIGSNMDYYFNVIAIHRNMHDTATARARYGAFKLYLEAMSEKRGRNLNVLGGWLGTSKDGVCRIMNNVSGIDGIDEDFDLDGFGVHIFSDVYAMDILATSSESIHNCKKQ